MCEMSFNRFEAQPILPHFRDFLIRFFPTVHPEKQSFVNRTQNAITWFYQNVCFPFHFFNASFQILRFRRKGKDVLSDIINDSLFITPI